MALSTLVPATVQAMFGLARDPTDLRHIWVLHGLWLTAEAAGLSYVPYVQVGCLTLLWSVHLYYLKVSGSLLKNMVTVVFGLGYITGKIYRAMILSVDQK
jgi:hypothetical protein